MMYDRKLGSLYPHLIRLKIVSVTEIELQVTDAVNYNAVHFLSAVKMLLTRKIS